MEFDGNANPICRTRDQLDAKLHDAKLEPSSFHVTGQSIYFDETLDTDGVRLLELDDSLLAVLEAGKPIRIKGGADDNAVVVTDGATYELRNAETSNLLLVTRDFTTLDDLKKKSEDGAPLSPVEFPRVRGMFNEYLEVRRIKPRLQKLRELLEEKPYSGRVDEKDESRDGKTYTFEELTDEVQASEVEIKEELKRLHSVEIDGRWRLLEPDYFNGVLNHVLNLIDENSWNLDAIPGDEVINVLKDLEPEEVLFGVLAAVEANKVLETEDVNVIAIDPDKVAINFAEVLLQKAGRFQLDDFLAVWRGSLPEEFPKPGVELLRGIALVDAAALPPSVTYFPRERLPEEAGPRFDYLFSTRPKWTLEDVSPFLRDLTTAKLDVGALLLKYARASTVNGVKYFSSRKTIGRK